MAASNCASSPSLQALAVERRMSAELVLPTVNTYTTLMSVCARAGDRRGMLRYFSLIGERGMRPTVASWNVVLDYCAKQTSTVGSSRVMQVRRGEHSSRSTRE